MRHVVVAFFMLNTSQVWAQNCEPPSSVFLDYITSNSFVLSSNISPLGGRALIEGGGINRTVIFNPGDDQFLVQNLPSDTLFGLLIENKCEEGFSEGLVSVAITLSIQQSNGLLTAPTYITENHVWLEASNQGPRAMVLLPDPNTDGWNHLGIAQLGYGMSVTQGCDLLFETDIRSDSYPLLFELPIEVPDSPYQIQITRTDFGSSSGKREGLPSAGTILVGPQPVEGQNNIPSSFIDIDRWLLHVPKVSGGFEGRLVLVNRFPIIPAQIWIAGFDSAGNFIEGSRFPLTVTGQRAEIIIYPNGSGEALFPDQLLDQVSHLGLLEVDGKQQIQAAISYKQADDPNALTATLEESDFTHGEDVGAFFVMESRKSENFWDGVAVLNLTQSNDIDIRIVQRQLGTDITQGMRQVGPVEPGHKLLAVVSELFPFCAQCYYSIESVDSAHQIEVLGLRGSVGQQRPVLVGAQVNKRF